MKSKTRFRILKGSRNNCYKNGKKISCKNKIFKDHFNAIHAMNSFSKKSFKKRCYINKKEVSCKNKIFKD